jgi:hypothetical protein
LPAGTLTSGNPGGHLHEPDIARHASARKKLRSLNFGDEGRAFRPAISVQDAFRIKNIYCRLHEKLLAAQHCKKRKSNFIRL